VVINKLQNADPTVFQGQFQATNQTYLIDSGCTTMVIGQKINEKLNFTSKRCKGLKVEYANQSQG
jgi:hypothetical protein